MRRVRWHLLDTGRGTGVQASRTSFHRPAPEQEIKAKDTLYATVAAERAAKPSQPLTEAFAALADDATP